ncbi:mite group 2 allergen-like Ixo r 2 [Ornithodoros turicata]|uniref:mite group 2 allergen-like Ixo r 2 n=1 Tax=Ornithodoros turicata TaxID=34597 RepID=UPI00313A3CDA
MRLLVFFLVFVGLAHAGHVSVSNCGFTSRATLVHLDVERCDSVPCIIKRGIYTRFEFEFIPHVNSRTLTLDARFSLFGINFPIPGVVSNLCKFVSCPIVAERTYRIALTFYISMWSPPLVTRLTYRIRGDDRELGCYTTVVELH